MKKPPLCYNITAQHQQTSTLGSSIGWDVSQKKTKTRQALQFVRLVLKWVSVQPEGISSWVCTIKTCFHHTVRFSSVQFAHIFLHLTAKTVNGIPKPKEQAMPCHIRHPLFGVLARAELHIWSIGLQIRHFPVTVRPSISLRHVVFS